MAGIWSFSKAMVTDPAEAKALGESIATYTLPDGYSEVFGMHFLGAEMVAIAGDITSPDSMMVMLMKIPNTGGQVDQEFLAKQFETAISQQFPAQGLDLTLDTVETRTIKDQEVPLTFRKGTDSAGNPYRQMSALIPGDDALFVMVQGAEAEWDQDALYRLLESIR